MALIRQSGPDSGLGFQLKVLKAFTDVPSSLGSGFGEADSRELVPPHPFPGSAHKTVEYKTVVKVSRLSYARLS